MTTFLATPHRPLMPHVGSDRVPAAATAIAVLSGLVGVVNVARSQTLTPASIGAWTVMILVIVVLAPLSVVRGASVLLAIVTAFTLAPNNTTLTNQYIGIGLAMVAMLGGLARSIGERSGRQRTSRSTFILVWMTAYLGILVISTVVSPVATSVRDCLVLVAAPTILVVVLTRSFSAADLRVLSRGILGFGVIQAIVATVDIFVTPVPFLGYAFYLRSANELLLGQVERGQGLAGHSIPMAVILGVGLLLILRDVAALSLRLRVGAGLILGWGLLLSGTRSAVVALVAAAGLVALVRARSAASRLRTVLIISTVLIVALANRSFSDAVVARAVELGQTGSYYHRAAALASLPELLTSRSALSFLIGSGRGSERSLYSAGLLQQDGLYVIDNQFVTAIAVTGMIGFLLLIVLLVRTILRSSLALCAVIVFMVVMFNSFDLLRWFGPGLLFFAVVTHVDDHRGGRDDSPNLLASNDDDARPHHESRLRLNQR